MLIEVDKLTGRALIWAAITAMGETPQITRHAISYRSDHGSWTEVSLTEAEAVELMRDHWIGLERPSRGQTPPQWRAIADCVRSGSSGTSAKAANPHNRLSGSFWVASSSSENLAVAVFRTFVKSRLGEAVEIPEELGRRDNAASIHLTPSEKEWLVKMASRSDRRLSLLMDNPPKRVMNALVKKSLATDVMGTFWELTTLGQQRCTSIY